MANNIMEELEIKEPTPSLAPSQYESPLYTKKWRIVLAVLLGVTLMGMCILGFYVSVKARGAVDSHLVAPLTTTTTPPPPTTAAWRIGPSGASCLAFVNDTSCPKDFSPPPLVVLGLDGLRPDALREEVTPALLYLRRCGATMHSLVPTYPTTTFPNLYTIATGLYPESHGIVGNRMHDPAIAKDFTLSDPVTMAKADWWGGQPIWNTITKQGRKSGILYWPGSDVSIQGSYPPYWKSYVTNLTSEQRITQVHEWLMLPEQERPQLIMVYFEEPMRTMQQYGMDSKEATEGLANMDRTVDELMNYLHQHKLAHCVNVMVVSDHGVIPFSCSNNFHLETFMPEIEKEVHVFTGAVGRLRSKSNKKHEEEILNSLRCKNPKVRALPKDLLPRRYHYANNNRIENVLLDTRSNTRVVTNSERICRKAEHGYNNLEAEMQATFIGFGPDFKVNTTTQSFRNVELYNLMCQLIHITPCSNNGTAGSLNHLLHDPPPLPTAEPTALPEEVLPPPNRMVEQRQPQDKCHCFTPEPADMPAAESLVRARRSGEGNSSGGSNNINNTESADSTDPKDDNSKKNNPATTTTSTTTPTPPTTTPSTTTTSSTTTTTPPPNTTPSTTTSSTTPTTTTTTSSTTPTTTTTSSTTPPTTTPTTTPATTTTTTTSTTTTTTTTAPTTTTPRARTEAELSLLLNNHVPWGSLSLSLPEDIQGKLKVLLHSSHVIGLHETLNLAVWTSFTVTNRSVAQLEEEESVDEKQHVAPCWRADPRLERPQQDQCLRMLTQEAFQAANVTLVQLFPKELETKDVMASEGYLLSNLAAVRAGYLGGARQAMVKAVKAWTNALGTLNVVHGPIFDYNWDGHQDTVASVLNTVKPLVPSNYFFVISQCGSTPCPDKPRATLAFVFPNTEFNDNCQMSDSEYLNYHLANVRDVELLTGLRFFRNVYGQAALEYRTMQPLAIWPLPPSS